MTQPIDAKAAASMLGISARKVYELANSGRIPCYRIDTAVRFDPQDVEAFRKSCRSATTPVTSAGVSSSTVTLRAGDSALADFFLKAGRIPKPTHSTSRKARGSTPLRVVSTARSH